MVFNVDTALLFRFPQYKDMRAWSAKFCLVVFSINLIRILGSNQDVFIWFLMRFIYRNIDQFASLESNILQPVCAALPPYFRKFIITPAVVKARDGDICKLRNWELRYNLGLSASSMSCFLRALFESMSQQTNGLVSLSLQYVVQFLLFRNELKIAELFHSSNYQWNLWDCFLGEQRNPLDPEPLCLNWAPKNGILNADGNRKFQNLNSVALDFKTCVK